MQALNGTGISNTGTSIVACNEIPLVEIFNLSFFRSF
jgi:hypothetical protein